MTVKEQQSIQPQKRSNEPGRVGIFPTGPYRADLNDRRRRAIHAEAPCLPSTCLIAPEECLGEFAVEALDEQEDLDLGLGRSTPCRRSGPSHRLPC